jgi:Fe-S cluster biogenesis protein NfuA
MDLMGQVEEILADFKKSLQADGGDIELLCVTDGIVKVSITRTIVAALEVALKEKIPQIIKVESRIDLFIRSFAFKKIFNRKSQDRSCYNPGSHQ